MNRRDRRKLYRLAGLRIDPAAFSPLRRAALDIETWVHACGGERDAREIWEAVQDAPEWHTMNPGHRPAPFWAYTEDVPRELRNPPERVDPRPILDPDCPAATRRAIEADGELHDQFHAARIAWLDAAGLLRPDERRRLGLAARD